MQKKAVLGLFNQLTLERLNRAKVSFTRPSLLASMICQIKATVTGGMSVGINTNVRMVFLNFTIEFINKANNKPQRTSVITAKMVKVTVL